MEGLVRVPVREQEPAVRATNFEEVCLGYNEEEAMAEAARCLNCKNAQCMKGCPVSINIPGFIAEVKEGNFEAAYHVISESSALPAVCGRVCPQETQCEGKCIRGIKGEPVSIGKLERFVADYALENDIKPEGAETMNGHKVAVIGSGPSGLTCAGDLAKLGYDVTVFEALHELGGVLVYGIPEFRLPKQKVVAKEIAKVKELGVHFETNVVIGKSTTIDMLIEDEGFEAVFIGSGAGLPKFMGIPGENANGVFSANEYLTRSNLMKAFRDDYDTPIAAGKKVAVVGGGNSGIEAAIDLAGVVEHVTVLEFLPELKADKVLQDKLYSLDNVTVLTNVETKAIHGQDKVESVDYVNRETQEAVTLELAGVFILIGLVPNTEWLDGVVERTARGEIIVDKQGATNLPGVFAAGDCTDSAYKQIIIAMGSGATASLGAFDYMIRN